ncbi:MAG TPA: response regulator [Gammaproteobacteria bacterium]|nr:response regulator [Gammaproteobacteria bacterium]
MVKKVTLLVVEDEEAIRDMLKFSLERNDFNVINAENIPQAEHVLMNTIPDVIILDWMLPGKSGIEFLKWVKKENYLKDIPIIMLTAKAEEDSKIHGLMSGADDYVTKPFSINELVARIKTILRRGILVSPKNEIKVKNMVFNVEKREVYIGTQLLKLLPLEYKLLHFFIIHPNKNYTRDQLITYIYGRNTYIEDRTIDVHIKRLREKLRPFKYDSLIKTIRGVGYCFIRDLNEKR